MKKALSPTLKLFFGVGNLTANIVWMFHLYYFSFILTDVMKLPLANVTLISTVGGLGAFVLTNLNGFIIRSFKPKKVGRYRRVHIILPVIYVFYIWSAYTKFSSDITLLTIILCFTVPISQWVAQIIPSNKNMLMAEISPDSESTTLLAAHNGLYGGIGSLIYSLIIVKALSFVQSFTSYTASFPILFSVFTVGMAIGHFIEVKMTKGYDYTADTSSEKIDAEIPQKEKISLKETLKSAFSSRPLLTLTLSYVPLNIVRVFATAMLVYYYTYVAESTALYTLHMSISSFLVIIAGFILPLIAKKMESKAIYISGIAITIVAHALILIYAVNSPVLFLICSCIITFCAYLLQSVSVSLFSDCAVYSEWKSGINTTPIVMNMHVFSMSASNLLRNILLPIALGASGYIVGEAATPAVKQGLVNAHSLMPLIFAAFSLAVIIFGYNLNKKKVSDMKVEIDGRKASV